MLIIAFPKFIWLNKVLISDGKIPYRAAWSIPSLPTIIGRSGATLTRISSKEEFGFFANMFSNKVSNAPLWPLVGGAKPPI